VPPRRRTGIFHLDQLVSRPCGPTMFNECAQNVSTRSADRRFAHTVSARNGILAEDLLLVAQSLGRAGSITLRRSMGRRNTPIDAKQTDTPAARFLRSAKMRRARDLEQLSILCEAVQGISELIHALQKERGASSIYLGSNGAQFAEKLGSCVAESGGLEERVRNRLERVDEKLDPVSCSARFYTRVAFAFRALDSLPGTREQVSALALAPQDAVRAFTEVITLLLAVGFEAADVAVDPETSRALIALVNFAQGKEYAGQERATAGAALSRGHFGAADQRLLLHLAAAQERALKIFTQFADPRHVALFLELDSSPEAAAFKQMRAEALGQDPGSDSSARIADRWYEALALMSSEGMIGGSLSNKFWTPARTSRLCVACQTVVRSM